MFRETKILLRCHHRICVSDCMGHDGGRAFLIKTAFEDVYFGGRVP